MRFFGALLVVALVAGVLNGASAITASEASAMNEMLRIFGGFSDVPDVLLLPNNNAEASSSGSAWGNGFDTNYAMAGRMFAYGMMSDNLNSVSELQIDGMWARAINASSISSVAGALLSGLTELRRIKYTIPSSAADELLLAPFIASLLSALPVTQMTSMKVIGTPQVLSTGLGVDIYGPVWSWSSLVVLEVDAVPTVIPVASISLTSLTVRYDRWDIVNPDGLSAINQLSLLDKTTGYAGPEGLGAGLPNLASFTVTLPALGESPTWPAGVRIRPSPTLTHLKLIGLPETSTTLGGIEINDMENVNTFEVVNLSGDLMDAFYYGTSSTPSLSTIIMSNVSQHVVNMLFCNSGSGLGVAMETIQISTSNGEPIDPISDLCLNSSIHTAIRSVSAPLSFTSLNSGSVNYVDVFPVVLNELVVQHTVNASQIDFTQLANFNSLRTLELAESALSMKWTDTSTVLTSLETMTSLSTLKIFGGPLGCIVGSMPASFFSRLGATKIVVSGHSSSLFGTIPTSGWTHLESLDLSGNGFTDMEALQASEVADSKPFNLFTSIDLSDNQLTHWFSEGDFAAMSAMRYFDFSYNPIEGTFPASAFAEQGGAVTISFRAANTSISGTLPTVSPALILLDLSYTNVHGSLPAFAFINTSPGQQVLNYAFKGCRSLNGTIPSSWSAEYFEKFDLSYTSVTHPSSTALPFTATPFLETYIDISNISISGDVWAFRGLRRGTLLLNDLPNVVFCPAIENAYPSYFLPPSECSMDEASLCAHTNTNGCLTTWRMLGCSQTSTCSSTPPTTTTPPPPPTNAPPTTATGPIAKACALPAPSSSAFTCIDGQWKTNTSVTTTALTVPAKAGTIVISGNMVTGSVTFDGLGTTLLIEGCVDYLPVVYVSLGDSDIKEIEQSGKKKTATLASISSNSSCANTTAFESVIVLVSTSNSTSSCKKVTVQKSATSGTSGASLNALFTLDNSKCQTWWVILVSVVCSVIFVVIVLILIVKFVPACSVLVRPFKGTGGSI